MSMLWRKPPPETRNTDRWAAADLNDLGSFGGGPYGTGGSWINVIVNEILVFPIRLLFWTARLLIWSFTHLKHIFSTHRG